MVTSATTSRARRRRSATSQATPAAAASTVAGRWSDITDDQVRRCSAAHSTTATAGRVATKIGTAAPGWTAATAAPTMATALAAAAAGTASMLAGIEASGTSPTVHSSSGATASWAPTVTASRSPMRPGGHVSRRRTSGARTSTPAVAPAESSIPREPAIPGSSSTSVSTATASACRGSPTTPRTPDSSTTAAMAEARRTLGSQRVSTANQTRPVASTTRRARGPARHAAVTTSSPAATSATFEPLTATRWVRPVSRMASSTSCGSSDVSPVTSPDASPAWAGGNARSAALRTRRRTVSVRANGALGGARCSHDVGVIRTAV